MAEYPGRLPLFHIDPYRLASAEDALAGGLIDERQREGVTVVEWPERLGDGAAGGPARRADRRDGRRAALDHARGGLGRLPALPGRRGMTHDGRRRAILAIDTATTRVVIATGTPGGVADGVSTWTAGYRHGETCCLDRAVPRGAEHPPVAARRASSWGRGPGAFTGLRVGIATAKGLAHGLGIPLVGVSTAEALIEAFEAAEGAEAEAGPTVLLLPAGPRTGSWSVPGRRARAAARRGGTRPRSGRAARGRGSRGPRPGRRARARRDGPRRPRPGAASSRRGQAGADHGRRPPPRSELETLVPDYVTLPRGVRATSGTVEWSRDPR